MNKLQKKIDQNQICCIIITYNPDSIIYELINSIKDQVDKIIIVDNKSDSEIRNELIKITNQSDIHLILNNENFGIAKALNQGVFEANKMNYNWAITFDQDTIPYSDIIETISEVNDLYPDKRKIGAIGVNFSISSTDSYYKISRNQKYIERDYLITSGCLLSVNTCIGIGGFREDFFIDNVDLEYALRLRKHNKVLIITKKHGMIHAAGNPIRKKIWGLFNVISSNHNSNRRYYMARNHIIISKEYFSKFPYFILKANYFFILSIIQLLILEEKKNDKISATYRGIIDGFKYKSKDNSVILNKM